MSDGVIMLYIHARVRYCRSDYGQAVRTLRSALNYEAKKLNGQFSRKDYNYNCYFALNKVQCMYVIVAISDSCLKHILFFSSLTRH